MIQPQIMVHISTQTNPNDHTFRQTLLNINFCHYWMDLEILHATALRLAKIGQALLEVWYNP